MVLFETIGFIIMLIIALALCLVILAFFVCAIFFVVMSFITFVYLPLKDRKRRKQS